MESPLAAKTSLLAQVLEPSTPPSISASKKLSFSLDSHDNIESVTGSVTESETEPETEENPGPQSLIQKLRHQCTLAALKLRNREQIIEDNERVIEQQKADILILRANEASLRRELEAYRRRASRRKVKLENIRAYAYAESSE